VSILAFFAQCCGVVAFRRVRGRGLLKMLDGREVAIVPTASWKISDRGNMGARHIRFAPEIPQNEDFQLRILHFGPKRF